MVIRNPILCPQSVPFLTNCRQLDRGNIGAALSDNFLKDIKVNTNDYNYGMTIFYCSFLFAEIPSQLISKKLGPDRWIPIQMVSWSLVASFQAFIKNKTGFFICRWLLGLIEGGFIPDTILYLSYFYTSKELPIRLSYFWVAYQSTNIVSAFLAYGKYVIPSLQIILTGLCRYLTASRS
jgi:MFS family permease